MNKKEFKTQCIKENGWRYYISTESTKLVCEKSGKWMYFFPNEKFEFALKICELAIKNNICYECKCTDMKSSECKTGVICFYNNVDDNDTHYKILSFMIENDLISKTSKGKYYNISFKLDDQTRNLEYGENFKGKLKVEQFIDLCTGELLRNKI